MMLGSRGLSMSSRAFANASYYANSGLLNRSLTAVKMNELFQGGKKVPGYGLWNSTLAGSRLIEKKQVVVDKELPDVLKEKRHVRRSLVGFAILMAATFTAIIKYEDVNAPVVGSTLYTLRRSETAREVLGGNIVFAAFVPWIYGKLQAGRGIVDFKYYVKGDKGEALVHFDARRSRDLNRFVVIDWSITKDGVKHSLLEEDFHPFVPGAKEEPTMRARA